VDDDYKVRCELVNPFVVDEFGEVRIVNQHLHAQISHHRVDEHYVDDMCGFFFETRIDCGNMVSTKFDEELKVEAATIATSYEAVGTPDEVGCEQETTEFGIGKAINRATSGFVDPTIGIVDVKFDEEPLIGDYWLHMMQQKEPIHMLLSS